MFLRRYERHKNGKPHTYWALCESYRTAKGSRQRVVAYLGELSRSERPGWAQLGQHLTEDQQQRRPQLSLFDPPTHEAPLDEAPLDDEPVLVQLSRVRLERLRDFGDVWLAWGLWRMLELDQLLEGLLPQGREDVSWATVAAILVIARLCEPSSELHIADTWYRRTALEDLLGVRPEQVHTSRLYAGLDHLLPHKESLEKHLRQRLGELFEVKCDLLLYDITSTYFEGDAEGIPMAKRGYSRDSRSDRPQVCIGLVVTEDGFPLGYEVFAGNTHDSKTVQQMIDLMEKKYGPVNCAWVMDRGMVSEANLNYLRERGGKYLVGTPKAMLKQFEQHLLERDWTTVQAGVEVKIVAAPDGSEETFVLTRSLDRREKELAMHARFTERLEAGLKKLQAAAESGRLKDEGTARERLGRIKTQSWRASHVFDVTIQRLDPPPTTAARRCPKAHLKITWQPNNRVTQWNNLADGCYLLRTNLTGVDPATLWKRYIQLTEAEWAFRISKDELEIRPIWHHKEDRVLAHILVCFLAYVLWKALGGWMCRSGLGDAPRTVLEEIAKIKSGDVVLPARTQQGGAERLIRLRCVTEPDDAQRILLHRLGLTLPRRLRRLNQM